MPLNPSDNPVFSSSLTALTPQSVAHSDTFNPNNQKLLDNDIVLKKAIDTNKLAADKQVAALDQRLGGVESSSAVSVQKAQALDWMYRNNVINFEMFVKGYTLVDLIPIPVVQGVNGDDSLDVADTSGLRAGEFYVLSDPAAVDGAGKPSPVSALVRVQSILSGVRVRLAANMSRDWGSTAVLQRSSIKVLGASQAAAVPGDIYLTRSINIGTDQEGGAAVVRRTLNSGLARLYFRDAYQQSWRECGWSQRRSTGDIPAGFADYEYIVPMRGDGWLRMEIEGEAMTIAHVVALGTPTGLGGYVNPNLRPNTPVVSAPIAAATGVMERPTLALAGYSSPAGNAQQAVNFQVSKVADFSAVLHDAGVLSAGLSYAMPAGVLVAGTTYYSRGRVQDVAGLWSDWSAVSAFTTAASFAYVVAPTITGPVANAIDVGEQPTFASSSFAVSGASDTHVASQWRLRSADGSFASPVWDSGTDTVNKVTAIPPTGKLKAGGLSYYVQVRHQGSARGWSEWSSESKITTKQSFGNVIGIVQTDATTWVRVDEAGNTKVTDASFFGSHAVYGGIQDQLVDSQYMVRIPAFYVKRATITSGEFQGKSAVWISDLFLPGYEIHPAFKLAGADLAQFWVGKYQGGTLQSGKAVSLPNVVPLVNNPSSSFRAWANARNVSGVSGFGLWNIYQLAAIQLLALIELGGTDVQALVGKGNCKDRIGMIAVTDHPLNLEASWRGVVGLWANVWQFVEGVEVNGAREYRLWDRQGNKLFRLTGRQAPGVGNITALATGKGDLFDFSDLFLPATTGGSSAITAFGSDIFYCRDNAASEAWFGGSYNDVLATHPGLFAMGISWDFNAASPTASYRLSKV